MNDVQMTKYLNMCKAVREFPINSVVGWYDSEELQFGVVKTYSYNQVNDIILYIEQITESSRTKIVRGLNPDNKPLNLFRVQ